MDLKFRLQNGEIYIFKNYTKYSRLIDELDLNPDIIIDTLEPFTIEDFETAHLEYHKYVCFRNTIDDIISKKEIVDIFSKKKFDELISEKEISKFNLNYPIFEWLMISETKEDKDIKDFLSFDEINYCNIKSDNIFLYYIIYNKTNQEKFNQACWSGHINSAQWLYTLGDVDINRLPDYVFITACENGHIKLIQWLYTHGIKPFDKENINDYVLFRNVCGRGHLQLAQWIYSLYDEEHYIGIEIAFFSACDNNYLDVAQWLYSLDDKEDIDIHKNHEFLFNRCIKDGSFDSIDMSKWLWSLGGFNKDYIHYDTLSWFEGRVDKSDFPGLFD